ncbi:MAG: glycoside hydrolase family 9 protein, partial [Gemmatimonas sp.]
MPATDPNAVVRINQVGYAPDAPKVAVVCALAPVTITRFSVETESGREVFGAASAHATGAFGPCVETYRLNFSALHTSGRFRVRAGTFASPVFRISRDVYAGLADTLMSYMRQQRSGYNPFLRDSAHKRDAIIVDHPARTGEFINVSGGWADAADYLQYVTTSATATYHLLS